jgi:hypothetical protein
MPRTEGTMGLDSRDEKTVIGMSVIAQMIEQSPLGAGFADLELARNLVSELATLEKINR